MLAVLGEIGVSFGAKTMGLGKWARVGTILEVVCNGEKCGYRERFK